MKQVIVSAVLFFACLPVNAAYIDSWRGEVAIKKTGGNEWARLAGDEKTRLANGDELRTARASTVEILMEDGSRVKLAPVSAFKMSSEGKDSVSLGLYFGRVRSWVKKFSKKFEVRTPSAVCAVRGTDFMVYTDEKGNSRVEVYEGSVLTGDSKGYSTLVREGQFAEIPNGGRMHEPGQNPNDSNNMDSAVGDPRQVARNEIYNEISKEDVIARAQEEIQSAEFQNRKVAIDAFGNRVRMEEYVIRPTPEQFKYVVLNTRDNRFDFGKILFTFNSALPSDLSLATANMMSAPGAAAPQWYLTALNSVMSNTTDKVTEDAVGGHMVYNGSLSAPQTQLVFDFYSFYAAGPAELNDNGGLGKWFWTKTGYNVPKNDYYSIAYQGSPTAIITDASTPAGGDTFYTYTKNTYAGGVWLAASDYVLFDDGKILSTGDLGAGLGGGATVDSVTDKLNFQRVYTSSLFSGRKIDLEFSAKLLKEAGLLKF